MKHLLKDLSTQLLITAILFVSDRIKELFSNSK